MSQQDDPILQQLRQLGRPAPAAELAERVRRVAVAELGARPGRLPLIPRVLAPAVLALVVVGYFTWSICFVLAGGSPGL